VACAVFVNVPTTLNAPPTVNVPLLVTVDPLRLTPPTTSIVPSFTTVTAGPSATPAPWTMIVAPERLRTVAMPFVFGCAANVTMPSLSRSAPESAASAGSNAVPRTNSRDAPLKLAGLKAAPTATQIVPPELFTDPPNVPDAKSTTSAAVRLRFPGMPPASGNTCVGLAQSAA
jgi:hypothetical protein